MLRPTLVLPATILGAAGAALLLASCQSAYYQTMEKFGYHKRDILTSRVQDARDSQEQAKEQFRSALEEFTAVLGVEGGELQKKYDKLNAAFQRSENKAEEVRDRFASVEKVSKALFAEWEAELRQYTNVDLRRASERKLTQTRQQYGQLIGAMKKAESRIEPVLSAFRDQVLFLKHNLNAQAVASLKGELGKVETNVGRLIQEMEASIGEADAFIQAMAKDE